MTEDEMVGWHYRINGYEFEQTPGDGEGQGSLACCCPRGCKESDMTERMNNNHQFLYLVFSLSLISTYFSCQCEVFFDPLLRSFFLFFQFSNYLEFFSYCLLVLLYGGERIMVCLSLISELC